MIAPWAAAFVGIPYKPNGRDPTGWDCYGCVYHVLRAVFQIELPSYAGCYDEPRNWLAMETAVGVGLRDWQPVRPTEAQVGDGVVLRLQGYPMHVGVLVDTAPLTMLHVLAEVDTCCQRLDVPKWAPRVVGCYQWRPRP
jgi:cell wall-associated NlpC family hydrolase